MPLTYKLGTQWGQLSYPVTVSTMIEQMRALKMTVFRVSATWNYAKGNFPGIEMTPGAYNSSAAASIASFVAELQAAGIEPLINMDISGEPPGGSQPGPLLASSWTSGPPCTPAQFATMMGWLVTQSGLQGLRWELCNEPDYEGQDYIVYTDALQQAYTAMKQADPTCTVHLGPVANINSGGGGYTFLQHCYNAGIQGYYDVLSFHLYTYPGTQGPDATTGTGTLLSQLSALKSLRSSHNDTTPLWLTETGWTWNSPNTPALQAQWYSTWLQELEGQGIEAVIPYDLYDYSGGDWGLAPSSGTPYQAYYEIMELQSGPRFMVSTGSRLRL